MSMNELEGMDLIREEIKKDKPDAKVILDVLARFTTLEYDQVREEISKLMNVRLGTLDKEVAKARGDEIEESQALVEELAPWGEGVDASQLLYEIRTNYNQYVFLPKYADVALSVWTLGTYCMDGWTIWPKILITSPEKRCGKTTLLEAMEGMLSRALMTSNISPSAIFRIIEEHRPSLVMDEADTFAKDNDELNGIVNAGHKKRVAFVVRTERSGDGFAPRQYSVWAPQVIAGIGAQRDTLHDRSIHIEMERKLPDEKVEKLPHNFFDLTVDLRSQCMKWALDNLPALRVPVEIPNYGNDRAQDNWEPLFRIAYRAGDYWVDELQHAYKHFSTMGVDEEDIGIILLRDIKSVIGARTRIHSVDLVELLVDLEDSPWGEWKGGKPMTQNSMARLLKPFKLKSKDIRIAQKKAKGYELEPFRKIFERYIPFDLAQKPGSNRDNETSQAQQGFQADSDRGTNWDRPGSNRDVSEGVSDETPRKPLPSKDCLDVSDETPISDPNGEHPYADVISGITFGEPE